MSDKKKRLNVFFMVAGFLLGVWFIVMLVGIQQIASGSGQGYCFTQYELTGPCSQNLSVMDHPQDYTQLVPYENESGKFWRCKVQNWTVRAC